MNPQFYPHIKPGNFPTVEQAFLFKSCAIKLPIPDPHAIYQWFKEVQQMGGAAETAYWSRLWPASIGLCYFLEKNIELIKNKKVLELGAGIGLPSLYAALYTNHVFCTDIHPNSILWAKNAAEHNGLHHIDHQVADWNHLTEDLQEVDTVLLSDGNYDPDGFDQLLHLTQKFLHRGTAILLSTPQRLTAKSFVASLLPFCKQQEHFDVVLNDQSSAVSVFYLAPLEN